jgi:hypothetical protein
MSSSAACDFDQLWDEPAIVLKRVEHAASLAAALSKYFRKRADAEQKYGKELASLHSGAVGAPTEAMIAYLGGSVSNSVRCVLGEAREKCDAHRDFMLALMEKVVAPLDSLASALEAQRKALATRLERAQRDHKAAADAMRRALNRYHDAALQAPGAAPDAADKLRALRADYVAALDAARLAHVVYFENELPTLLREAHQTQTSFGIVLQRTFAVFVEISQRVPTAHADLLAAIGGICDSIDVDADLLAFTAQHRHNSKPPAPPAFVEPDAAGSAGASGPALSSSSAAAAAAAATPTAAAGSPATGSSFSAASALGSKFKTMAGSVKSATKKALAGSSATVTASSDDAAAESVFGADLSAFINECAADATGDPVHRMLAQRFRLPWCLVLLCDALLQAGGQQTEGCFRLSGSTSEVARVRADLNRGAFSLANSAPLRDAVTSPHTLATLLKQFCRSLSPSLVPADLADRVRQHPAAAPITDALELLPAEHRAAIAFLTRFVQQHFLEPDVVQKTKMGLDNLTLILGPCVFGDHTDATSAVMHLDAEQAFVRRLLNELPASLGTPLPRALQVSRNPHDAMAASGGERQSSNPRLPPKSAAATAPGAGVKKMS